MLLKLIKSLYKSQLNLLKFTAIKFTAKLLVNKWDATFFHLFSQKHFKSLNLLIESSSRWPILKISKFCCIFIRNQAGLNSNSWKMELHRTSFDCHCIIFTCYLLHSSINSCVNFFVCDIFRCREPFHECRRLFRSVNRFEKLEIKLSE